MKIERTGKCFSTYKTRNFCRILFLVYIHNSFHKVIFKFMSSSFMDVSLIKLSR